METRVEIFKDELWQPLRLSEDAAIKYNAVINRIGKVATREISHTNTFSLPYVQQNIQVLGLNVFNPKELARAMNAKYVANYYVEDKLLQSGFLVINNASDGVIKVNFIDDSLSLTEKWGSTTFKELLEDDVLEFPADYATAISELRNYNMTKVGLLTPLPQVGTRGHNLCLFPNNLNTIGDKFQIDSNDLRQDDVFNPYQSRPVFNAKALLDLATITYGYTPIYDDSVDWDIVEDTYIVNKGQDENKKGENGTQNITHPYTSLNHPFYWDYDYFLQTWNTKHFFSYSATTSLRPNDIPNWVNPAGVSGTSGEPWLSQYTVFTPNVAAGNVGTLQFIGDFDQTVGGNTGITLYAIWKNTVAGQDVVTEVLPTTHITEGTTYAIDVTLDKVQFDTVPSGADSLIGIMLLYSKTFMSGHPGPIRNMTVIESYLPEGVVAFDEYGQFLPDTVDLSYNAPTESLKNLISAVMHKEGVLMDINDKEKTVKFFNYGEYEQKKEDGDYLDWSKYLLKYNIFKYNTDYGNQYAKKNRIALTSPYQGNYFDITLENQGLDSKYKDFTENYVSLFNDVSNVVEVDNTTTPYFEFTHEGLGLVEYDGTLGTLTQERADGTSHGTFSGLAKLANVNYARIPDGVRWWYDLVDEAIRVEADFLIPVDVIKNLDMSEPIYVEELGGFYIIEEIKEYVDGSRRTSVKLIKLIDDLRGLIELAVFNPATIFLTTNSVTAIPPVTYVDSMIAKATYTGYTPANDSTVTFKKLTSSGGIETGYEYTRTITPTSPYTNQQATVNSSLPITAQEEGYYKVQVTDAVEGISSNEAEVYFGDEGTTATPRVGVTMTGNPSVGSVEMLYYYENFTAAPTFSTFEWQKVSYPDLTPTGPLRTRSFPLTPESGTESFSLVDGAGFYVWTLRTNEADSEAQINSATAVN